MPLLDTAVTCNGTLPVTISVIGAELDAFVFASP
jgi:hypothetical protein